ncbi:hypothetical protein AB0N06_33850 [Streptomyces sp. NPDC051020]|uniref:hypothetical protein n=1 Tax=Streptomyces sp. NPDC051020 TaxID=3155409 RepID=UPI00344233FC
MPKQGPHGVFVSNYMVCPVMAQHPPERFLPQRLSLGRLADKTRQCTLLKNRLQAAATAIAALHHDNQALRDELAKRTGRVVVPLRRRP